MVAIVPRIGARRSALTWFARATGVRPKRSRGTATTAFLTDVLWNTLTLVAFTTVV
jgi:hypothetical protein